jgi:hypothetical protein
MSSIGFPDWGFSYSYPVDPSKCVVFSARETGGVTGTLDIYLVPAGQVVVVAAMSVGVTLSIAGNYQPYSKIQTTKGIDGTGGVQDLIQAAHSAKTITLADANISGSVETELGAAIAIAGGVAGNTIRWAFDTGGTQNIVPFANVIIYKTQ